MWGSPVCRRCDGGKLVGMPGENPDGLALGKKSPAGLELASDPNMVTGHAELGGERLPLPNMPLVKEGAGLNRHLIIGVDGPKIRCGRKAIVLRVLQSAAKTSRSATAFVIG